MSQMTDKPRPDWDPRSDTVVSNQIKAYDAMRHRCQVAYSDYLGWSLFRYEDVARALDDHQTFSSVVSRHLSVPSGMDPPLHTAYRRLIERHFEPERVESFEPLCRTISADLVSGLGRGVEIDLVTQLAQRFAVRIQCAFLGWPDSLHQPLLQWVQKNHEATLARDTSAMAAIALEFDGYISQLLEARREAGAAVPGDITSDLLRERVGDRPLNHEEIVSILRNWTVGELGTITACVGILGYYLAENPQVQQRLREGPHLLPAAIDEILRMHAPLIANRRVATRPVEIGGRKIAVGERVTLMWASANRDEAVFGHPDEFRLDRDPARNLLYGRGIHVCPGAQLARLELRVLMEELLKRTRDVALVPGPQPTIAIYPASGFSCLPMLIL
ncbi:cytochrome P450 [Mesorhizobium sp. M1E.F.Ca.ET.045.02.1.1]|uniref:cytochrome P450 n=1 Tax=Mesorhizobium sp. M1E.F.Ca.ET.045.02.1.1 TaxID=2493672 RepID=UPI000F758898|nr:cytochrome P450 [Mesorhizobium sp. M1E.F.Ca.ET.045.02.1.1]AZO23589.1 cytochrome P450 [Mesorhizobium sp. M1E.F.Ca.ET.045.02.1.1]